MSNKEELIKDIMLLETIKRNITMMHNTMKVFNVSGNNLRVEFINNEIFQNALGVPVLTILECLKMLPAKIRRIFYGDTEFGKLCKISNITKPKFGGVSMTDYYEFVWSLVMPYAIYNIIEDTVVALRIDLSHL